MGESAADGNQRGLSPSERDQRLLDVLLAEYASVNEAIRDQIGFQTQTFAWGAAGFAILTAAMLGPDSASMTAEKRAIGFVVIGVVSALLGMFLVDKDRFVLAHITYIECVLRPKVNQLLGATVMQLSRHKRLTLYGAKPLSRRWFAQFLTGPFPHIFFIATAGVGVAGYAWTLWFEPGAGQASASTAFRLATGIPLGASVLWLIGGVTLVGQEWRQLGRCTGARGGDDGWCQHFIEDDAECMR